MKNVLPIPIKHTEITFELLRERIEPIRDVIAPKASRAELNVFAQTCVSLQLNPFVGDVYWIPTAHRVMVSRQGYLKLVQRTGQYRGLQSAAVWSEDDFAASIEDGVPHVHHVTVPIVGVRTAYPLGAWALLWMRGYKVPLYAWAGWVEHARDLETKSGHDSVWAQHPDDMIRKVAETHVLRRAVGDTGFARQWEPITVEEIDHEVPAFVEIAEQRAATEIAEVSASKAALVAEQDRLVDAIKAAEATLSAAQWDSWHVTKRRIGSRIKHAGTQNLREAGFGPLNEYLRHLEEVISTMRASDGAADETADYTQNADDAAAEALFEERVHDDAG